MLNMIRQMRLCTDDEEEFYINVNDLIKDLEYGKSCYGEEPEKARFIQHIINRIKNAEKHCQRIGMN